MEVIETASMVELDDVVDNACPGETTVSTDEWNGNNRIGMRHGHVHRTVDHSGPKSTRAIGADGDGVREAHCNTPEGLRTRLRNFLRPFRGVSKWFLPRYVAVFEWGYDLKSVTDEFMRVV
jgi:transposase